MDRFLGAAFFAAFGIGFAYVAIAYDRRKHGDLSLDAASFDGPEGCLAGCLLGPLFATEAGARIGLGLAAVVFGALAAAVFFGRL